MAVAAFTALRRHWVAVRNRWLANPKFQRWATAFALTRPIANTRAKSLFDLCAGFVYSQVLSACCRLQVFEHLSSSALSTEELAGRIGLEVSAAERLLRAAASLGLTEEIAPNQFALGIHGAALRANPGVLAMIEHHALLYDDLRDTVALLQRTHTPQLQRFWAYARSPSPANVSAAEAARYSALMAASQHLVIEDVLAAYSLKRHRRLLDVGGGTGTFALAAVATAPALHATVFDLPAVAELARTRFAHSEYSSRLAAFGGDAWRDEWPAETSPADLVTLVRVAHDHDDDALRVLLSRIVTVLPTGGRVLIAEPMTDEHGRDRIADAYFGMYLWAMGQGHARSVAALICLAQTAGFARVWSIPTRRSLLVRIVVAER